jgi:hypothetical protein
MFSPWKYVDTFLFVIRTDLNTTSYSPFSSIIFLDNHSCPFLTFLRERNTFHSFSNFGGGLFIFFYFFKYVVPRNDNRQKHKIVCFVCFKEKYCTRVQGSVTYIAHRSSYGMVWYSMSTSCIRINNIHTLMLKRHQSKQQLLDLRELSRRGLGGTVQ